MMRFLLWVLVLCWGVALLRRAVAWMLKGVVSSQEQGAAAATGEPKRPEMAAGRLVRDPVCGVHVAQERALELSEGGSVVHFCSTACRDQYLGNARKFAAHG